MNPSIYICPPLGPADGPASACRSDSNSSGSSGKASSSLTEIVTDPALLLGFKVFYNARLTSSHGDSACASCHVFGDFDGLSWDLGNPDAETVSVYIPAGRFLNSYRPCPLLWTTIGEPVAGVIMTLAPAMAAPEGSLTCPCNDPVGFCAKTIDVQTSNKTTLNAERR